MLSRILEPEVMDTVDDAREYDAMDHAAVNTLFINDLIAALPQAPLRVLDLGAGTAQIPIELARRAPNVHMTAVDAADSMLALARANIAAAQQLPLPCREGPGEGSSGAALRDRIELILADAKQLPFADASFDAVISNSIIHHIPEPLRVIAEAVRVTVPGGLLFHRDLARPLDESALQVLVNTYANEATPYQRRLFDESLHAALTAEEMANLVANFGFAPDTVRMTSDRHWTWVAPRK